MTMHKDISVKIRGVKRKKVFKSKPLQIRVPKRKIELQKLAKGFYFESDRF